MPVARSIVPTHPTVLTGPGVDGGAGVGVAGVAGHGASMDTGDGADDGAEADDGRLYCWCQVTSYGDMVACDDNECKHEWVSTHLPESLKRELILFVFASSIWGASGSTSHQRVCGSATRAESSLRTNASWRVLLLREEEAVARTGILVRRVRLRQRLRESRYFITSPYYFVCYLFLHSGLVPSHPKTKSTYDIVYYYHR